MTPEESADIFIKKFTFADIYFTTGHEGAILNAKQCAIKCVEQLIEENSGDAATFFKSRVQYWQETLECIKNS